MADYKEVRHERLFVKVPGGDKLRKTAASRLQHLLGTGWRETDRFQRADHIELRLERTGHAPMQARLPRYVPEQRFERRRGGGRPGFGGGPGGRGRR